MKLLFNNILKKAINTKVTDVHFIPSNDKVYIKFRVQDVLTPIESIQRHIYLKLLTYMKYQAGLDVSKHNVAQSGRYTYKFKQIYFLRISTLPLSLGIESCVIRIVPQYFQNNNDSTNLNELYKLMIKKQGLILFSGPTGSGKSTLMYQMVMYAKEQLDLNIITVEDSVEQLVSGITQVSINEKAGINYANTFKAILRCDPDIILIGEIRDDTIAKYVMHASLSGHLVLTTIHANNCKGALLRLKEMGITMQEMKQALLTVLNQRLITTYNNKRKLVYEQLTKPQINHLIDNDYTLPNSFSNLSTQLSQLAKAGVICEETMERYI